ncbi:DNA-methyltransferase [Dellaglioa algida]|uniref:DNA-methyltransferase n=1 Tax=Dellaglioa algida TaxID=105612 RepID=UPI0024C4C7B9|nr:site-specific DNA-methyltransferase [Dellaglioa algida]MDK1742879.1 site-specific DNA-methyltransferase [Dellaglioa algida]
MKIYNNDAYKLIDKLIKDDTKVDHIITDPPYNISVNNNFSTMSSANRKGIDFGEWDKNFDLYSWIPKYNKILNAGGTFIVFTSFRYISFVVEALESTGDIVVKDVIKWIKNNPMPRNINRRYVVDTEYAVWAVKKGKKWVFNKPDDEPYKRAEFRTPTVSGKERTNHPTQKSLKLMKDLINIHTNKDEIVLDPFMGSGTTGVAALELNRDFIGIEIDKDYFEIAKNRLNIGPQDIDIFNIDF